MHLSEFKRKYLGTKYAYFAKDIRIIYSINNPAGLEALKSAVVSNVRKTRRGK